MRTRPVLALALALLLAGCLRPGPGSPQNARTGEPRGILAEHPVPCDPAGDRVYYSGNAPTQPLFRRPTVDVARAFLAALGDALTDNGNATTDGSDTYLTERGILRVDEDAAGRSWSYTTESGPDVRDGNESLRWVLAVLNRTGVDGLASALPRVEGNGNGYVVTLTEQVPQGTVGKGAQAVASPHNLLFTLFTWHDLREAKAEVGAEEAARKARDLLDCERARNATLANETQAFLRASPAGFQVRHGSLALVVGLTYGPSGERRCGDRVDVTVLVDAVTGAIHEWRPPPCL